MHRADHLLLAGHRLLEIAPQVIDVLETAGNRTVRMLADNLTLVDTRGREFRPSTEANTALAMSGDKDDLVAAEIQPGIPREM